MIFDIKTVFLCNILIALSFGVSYLVYANYQKTYQGFMVWTAATFCNAFGFICFLFRGPIPPPLSIVLTNFLLALVVLLRLDATLRYLRGIKLKKVLYITPFLVSSACSYFYFIEDRVEIRNLIISTTLLIFLVPIVRLFIRYPTSSYRFLYYAVVSFIGIRVVVAWVGAILGYHYSVTSHFEAGFYSTLTFVVLLLGEIGIGIVFLLINNQRVESELLYSQSEMELSLDRMRQQVAKFDSLAGIVPICSYCKGMRDDQGIWHVLEKYIGERAKTRFSHGICPECMKQHFPYIEVSETARHKARV